MASIADPLVVPEDVDFSPVGELSPELRRRLACDAGDVAITRHRSRTPSKVINAAAAGLLKEFRTPTTLGDGVLRYSIAIGSDPHETLREAFPLIQELVNSQLLVPGDTPQAEEIVTSLAPGAEVDRYTIVRCVQSLDDSELYQARGPGDALVALKLVRAKGGALAARLIEHESRVLRHMAEKGLPIAVEAGLWDGRAYLVQPWLGGVAADVAAAECRQAPLAARGGKLLSLCVAMLDAYAGLHARGVVHGDIHPRNILVDADGRIHLIDFGLARIVGARDASAGVQRGGVGFFFEPEYASARLAKQALPAASLAGEQYALGALVYLLLTGHHYCDFSLGQDEMLREIASEEPLAFARRGARPWPAVEAVLRRALSKDPRQRYPDLDAFAAALKAAGDRRPDPESVDSDAADSARSASGHGQALLSRVLQRLGWDGALMRDGWTRSPTASINYGASGAAHVLYHVATVGGDPAPLALADVWATRAAAMVGDEGAFHNPAIEITADTVGRVSPYHSPSGVFAVQAMIALARGDDASLQAALAAFGAAARAPCDNLDLTLGQSGVLLANTLLVEALPSLELAERAGLLSLGESGAARIAEVIGASPPIARNDRITTLGIAHGWAGLIYALLRWCEASGQVPPEGVSERLDQLAAYAEPIGRGARWPWQVVAGDPSYMPGWCNGSAGLVFLWALAHRMLDDSRYGKLAEMAAWNAWEEPGRAANLCCGWAGRGYALLHCYKHTGDPAWLARARIAAERAAEWIGPALSDSADGYQDSLYKGELGVAALVFDLASPGASAMPLFESEPAAGDRRVRA
ncbi:MAG: protein kinase [Rhodocyclaceae bacterium]|nr:protein kinase [Rhodocyclaceae bacterium]